MKRPNRRPPQHAQTPQPARSVTAICIISFFIAALLVGLILLICASHKLAGDANGKPPKPHPVVSSSPSYPLSGDGDAGVHAKRLLGARAVTTLPTEPLEGGGSGLSSNSDNSTATAKKVIAAEAAPQQRDRPAIEMMQSAVVEAQVARERRIAVWRINTWFAQRGGPMQGLGECFIANQERTGIPASLVAGICEAESSNGMKCYHNPPGGCSYNAYGMIGPEYRGGFASWEEGIRANFDYLVKHFGCPQTMHGAPGYCEGDTTMATVDWAQGVINAYEPPEGI